MDSSRFLEDGFNEYLNWLIESNRLEPMQAGITMLVLDKGLESLSYKQRRVFDYMVDQNAVDCCCRCGSPIPWNEMSDAVDNGGYCGYCQYMKDKLDKE